MPVSAAAGTIVGSAYAETSFHGDAVADVAALTAIVASNRFDRQERTVESPLNQYVFDEQSAAADNPPDILEPDDSPATGRWIRLVPGGGVPASHAASHAENASDEIFVENLGAISVVTTDALMPDGTGGLVFGAPAPAAHALGGALHTADTLSNLNSKITDATLVDSADVVLRDGTQTLTGTWNVGAQAIINLGDVNPNGTGVRTLGVAANVWATVFTRSIEPDSGQTLSLNAFGGNEALRITTGANIIIIGDMNVQDDRDLTFGSGTGGDVAFQYDVQQLNNGLLFGLQGAEGNYILITDKARINSDRLLPAFDNPTLVIEDGEAATGNWGSIAHDGTDFLFTANAGVINLNSNVQVGGNIVPDGDGTRDSASATAVWGTTWTRIVRPDSGLGLSILNGQGNAMLTFLTASMIFNDAGLDIDARFEGDNDPNLVVFDAELDRVGVGVAAGAHLAKFHVAGGILGERDVEANTAVEAGPNVIIALESRRLFTNEGVAAENHHDLPPAVAGLEYSFYVQDTDGIQINAATGDTIRIGATVSASAGFISSTTVGDIIHLIAINATEWIGHAGDGANNWTFDT